MSTQQHAWLDQASNDPDLMQDFLSICGFGGRLAGTGEDEQALDWALGRLQGLGLEPQRLDIPYDGWSCRKASLELMAPGSAANQLSCHALLRSMSTPDTGLEAEVIDLGQGREADFERLGQAVPGKIVLVRHEYPFSPDHVHRRRKYDLAVSHGASGFLIANPHPGGGLMSGSSGRPVNGHGIPAAYIDHASGQILENVLKSGPATVRLTLIGQEAPSASARIGVLDIPGGSVDTIVISAHIDGHPLGASALDNATGVAVALAAARALRGRISRDTHSLRICLFSAEEWALAGSRCYLDQMSDAEKSRLKLNLNLDTVAGDDTLTALTSGFPALDAYVREAAASAGLHIGTHLPLMPNSDHANFARSGIPALRLLAGFGKPDSRVRHILSGDDLPGIVKESELRQALKAVCAMADFALHLPSDALAALAAR